MINIERDVEVGALATFGVPARAAAVCRWESVGDLRAALADASLPRPLKMVGGGANLLFTRPWGGTLLVRSGEPRVELRGTRLRADGHAVLDSLVALAAEKGLRGLENLAGIPGTLGGALVQNAGAYGAETGEFLAGAELMDTLTGEVITVDREWMGFGYRSSRLKSEADRYIVLSAELELLPASAPARLDYGNLRSALGGAEPTPEAVREAVVAMRDSKLPRPGEVGSAGSFFRNPEVSREVADAIPEAPRFELANGLVKIPAAWLIDRCGLKGRTVGGARVWPLQPLVIVNAEGRATAADVLALENLIVETVERRFGIRLTPEVEHL